jgi:rubrerythrin
MENMEECDYYICSVCGHTHEKEAPGKCPVCGANANAFFKAE